jgi:dihydrofolate reductase
LSISIDGFVRGPHGEIDWIFRNRDAGSTEWIVETLNQAGVHIMGHRTYHDMAAYWPTSELPFAAPMNEIPKVVFSRSGVVSPPSKELTTTALTNATEAQGAPGSGTGDVNYYDWLTPGVAGKDLAADITRLKQIPGGYILAHGGASFAQSLAAENLVDEYRLLVHPVALGKGLGLFSELRAPLDLKLVDIESFAGGTVAKCYKI